MSQFPTTLLSASVEGPVVVCLPVYVIITTRSLECPIPEFVSSFSGLSTGSDDIRGNSGGDTPAASAGLGATAIAVPVPWT